LSDATVAVAATRHVEGLTVIAKLDGVNMAAHLIERVRDIRGKRDLSFLHCPYTAGEGERGVSYDKYVAVRAGSSHRLVTGSMQASRMGAQYACAECIQTARGLRR
jgi:hypothetical protein